MVRILRSCIPKDQGSASSSPVLVSPNFDEPFTLYVDASDIGAGAVLCQADGKGIDHPVCFFSKKFTVEKETLSLILALRHFEVYAYSASYSLKVYTDHNPLVFLSRMSSKNQRIMRWSLELQKHNLDVHHIKGKENVIADALSRNQI